MANESETAAPRVVFDPTKLEQAGEYYGRDLLLNCAAAPVAPQLDMSRYSVKSLNKVQLPVECASNGRSLHGCQPVENGGFGGPEALAVWPWVHRSKARGPCADVARGGDSTTTIHADPGRLGRACGQGDAGAQCCSAQPWPGPTGDGFRGVFFPVSMAG